jgi:hypothetical protein
MYSYDTATQKSSSEALGVLSLTFDAVPSDTSGNDSKGKSLKSPFLDHFIKDNRITYDKITYENIGGYINSLDKGNFYTYQGSLTTPTCDEKVTWIVVKDPIYATEEQI